MDSQLPEDFSTSATAQSHQAQPQPLFLGRNDNNDKLLNAPSYQPSPAQPSPQRVTGRDKFQFQSARRGSSGSHSQFQFQYHQIPVTNNNSRGRGRAPFLERYRSQNNIHEGLARKRNGSSASIGTFSLSAGSSGQAQSGNQDDFSHSQSQGHPKPKKWFSFTNLLNKQNLSSLLNLPKSTKLSVSSTLNSVLVGSPSPTGSVEGGTGGGFFGLNFSPNDVFSTDSGGPSVVFRRKSGRSGAPGRYPSESTNSASSEKSSSFYTGHSVGSSRLSCGDFFTGTPNSPCSNNPEGNQDHHLTPVHLQHQFQHQPNFNRTESYCSSYSSGLQGREQEFFQIQGNWQQYNKTLGRSLPTLLESMESGIASQGSSDAGGPPSYHPHHHHVTVDAVMEIMYQEYAILTGAKTLNDHYILTFPDRGNFHNLMDEDYRKLMIYLTALPPMHDSESGFVIIVDRRNDKWNSVKATLTRISNFFPGLIHRVFVLRPVGLFQKALSEISSKLFRTETLRFRLTVCNSISELYQFVHPSQLTMDLGGTLLYDRVKWVGQRVEVEAFHAALQTLSRELKGFTEGFTEGLLEYPNDVASTESLIQEKHGEFQRLRTDLSQAIEHGEHLLFRIKDMSSSPLPPPVPLTVSNGRSKKEKTMHMSSSLSPSSVQLINAISVERYIIQIEETTRLFEEFWIKEKGSLEQCLQLRRFEQDFREMQGAFERGIRQLDDLPDMGDSLQATDQLIKETLEFQSHIEDEVSRAVELEKIGREIVECNQSAVDSVEPKCLELSRMAETFQSISKVKICRQQEWRAVQSILERANCLCNEGMDLMTMTSGGGGSDDDAVDGVGMSCHSHSSLLGKMDDFLDGIRHMGDELRGFKTGDSCATSASTQAKPLIKQVLQRVEDVELMCVKKRTLVSQQLSKYPKSRRSSGSGSSFSSQASCELKSARSASQLTELGEDLESLHQSIRAASMLSLEGARDCDWDLKRIKRGHVLNELMQTEKIFVEEIGEVLVEYRDQISNPDVRTLLPAQLLPITTPSKLQQRNPNIKVLFGNLEEIHAFHAKRFLPDLSNCVGNVELVGLCFIQKHEEFLSLYSQYCQLLPASETLRKEIGENHPWFVACRNRLGHKLPLGAYLLKPVQRITKYHLLLKDLVKTSEGCDGYAHILEALECMLVVLRCVNDGMHQLGITGYPGKLIDEGYLLLQGPFQLWSDNKKDRLRLTGHQRHLFLYQRAILICKKVPKSTLYEFRNKFSLSEIGITPSLNKGSSANLQKKFEIWMNGRQKVFLLQAESVEMKEMWVKQIEKLLLEQLETIRSQKSQTIAGFGSQSMDASSNRLTKGVTLNGWRQEQPFRNRRPLRQVKSGDLPGIKARSTSRGGITGTPNQEDDDLWSSDSNSEEEMDDFSARTTPSSRPLSMGDEGIYDVSGSSTCSDNEEKFVAWADYQSLETGEVTLKEGDVVTLVKVGSGGWWFIKKLHSTGTTSGETMEGWAPSAYLDKVSTSGEKRVHLSVKRRSSSLTRAEVPSRHSLSQAHPQKLFGKKDMTPYLLERSSTECSETGTATNSFQSKSQSTEELSALR